MALRYWVGGTNTWDGTAGTKWALTSGGAGGQAVPTSADDVFFDAASGANTVAISTGNTGAKSINCTGFTGAISGTVAISVSGSITFVTGMTLSYTGAITILATGTLTTGGKTLGPITIGTAGAVVTLGSALTSSGTITLSAGTLTTSASNYALTAIRLIMSGTGVKALTLNASTVTLSSTGSAFAYSGSNLTLSAGTSTIIFSRANANLEGGSGLTFNNVSFTGTTFGSAVNIFGANTFNTLTFTSPDTVGIIKINFTGNQTITTLIASGTSITQRLMLQSDFIGTTRTLTVGTYTTKQNVDFRDITAAGVSSPWSGTALGDCLGNTNITFSAAKTVYWNLTGAQNWTSTAWATTSGGTPALANFPLAQDTAVLDNTGAATQITIDNYINIGTFNSSTRTTAVTIASMFSVEFYGNFTAGTGVTISTGAGASPYFSGRSTQTLTSTGQSFYRISSTSPLCTISIADAFIATAIGSGILLQRGASFSANFYNVTVYNLTVQGTGGLNIGTAIWTIFGTGTCWNVAATATLIGSAEITLSDTSTTARTFAGGGQTYGKLTIGGTTGISTTTVTGANTFSEIASTKTVAHTIVFPIATTIVGVWSVNGSAGNLVTLSRTGASGTFTLTKSGGGVVSANYLSISNSTATPSLTWYAGITSTDGGGNTGWIFTKVPTASGNFLMMFM